MKIGLVVAAAALAGLAVLPTAATASATTAAPTAAGPSEPGRVTGVVSSSQEAQFLPCGTPVAACFPKPSTTAAWRIDQPDGCWLRSDVTTGFRMMGTCVLTIDHGTYVKAWAPPGAVDQRFTLTWG